MYRSTAWIDSVMESSWSSPIISRDSSFGDSTDDFKSSSYLASLDINESCLDLFEKDQIDSFKKAFKLLDKDGDGHIQTKELRSALRNLGQNPTDLELQDIVNEMDIDRNGTIDFTEFVKMLEKSFKQDNQEDDFKAAFDVFDTDGYGFVDAEEIQELLASLDDMLTKREQKEILAKAGEIENGKMTYEQFVKLLTWT